jgi:hypothetical protein
LWGWKDPRTCLTLPFWQDLVGPMRYVICLRNPCAVVASLSRRSEMSPESSQWLWLAYVQASLAHTSGHPRLFVFYEDIIEQWLPQLRRMAAFVGYPERAEDAAVQSAVADFVEQEMCHYRMTLEDLAVDPRISFPTKSLYFALRGHAPVAEAVPPDRVLRSLNKSLDMFANWSLDAWDRLSRPRST